MIRKIYNKVKKCIYIYILKDKFTLAIRKWFKDNGDNTLRLEYSLDENSIVFDVGGFEGEFARKIYEKYKCQVYVFEPVNEFYTNIKKQFQNYKKIQVFNFGLSNENKYLNISVANDASSVYALGEKTQEIQLRSIIEFLEQSGIKSIDLMKINIEGGEFDVLPCIIKNNYINKIKNLQIQFHNFVPNAVEKRDEIRKKLIKTHEITYDYYFVWENWSLVQK